MKMRNIFKIAALSLSALALIQCSDKYEQPSPDYSKGMMETNFNDGSKVNIGEYVSLIDLSQGVVNRLWSVDDDAYFVLGDETTDRVDIAYTEPGTKYITLNNTFLDADLSFENTVYLTVLKNVKVDVTATHILLPDDPMTEAPDLNDDGEIEDSSLVTIDYTPITISTGEFVDFLAVTEGQPSNYIWNLEGSDIEEGEYDSSRIVRAGYYAAGTYDVEITAYREYPDGEDTILLEDFITVVPSDKSGIFRSAVVNEDETITASFTQQMEALGLGANGFTVKRNGVPVEITSAALSSSSLTKVVLTVSGGIWSGDEVSLSYDGSALTTLAGNPVDSFDDVDIETYYVNLITNGTFDTEELIFTSKEYPAYAATDPQYCSITTINSERTLKLDVSDYDTDGGNNIIWYESSGFTLQDGVTYMFEYSYYIPTGNVGDEKYGKLFITETQTPWNGYLQTDFDYTTSMSGWYEYSATFEYDAPSVATDGTYEAIIKIENIEAGETIYIDNVKLFEYKKHTDIAGTPIEGSTITSQGTGETL